MKTLIGAVVIGIVVAKGIFGGAEVAKTPILVHQQNVANALEQAK